MKYSEQTSRQKHASSHLAYHLLASSKHRHSILLPSIVAIWARHLHVQWLATLIYYSALRY